MNFQQRHNRQTGEKGKCHQGAEQVRAEGVKILLQCELGSDWSHGKAAANCDALEGPGQEGSPSIMKTTEIKKNEFQTKKILRV